MRALRLLGKAADLALAALFLFLFLIGAYTIYDSYYIYSGVAFGGTMVYRPKQEPESMIAQLSDECVAWISLEQTGVDFPVMYAGNNSKYLNTDPYGNYSLAGSVFLDMRNAPDFSDPYMILYGHHMEGNAMFGCLDHYLEAEYFRTHKEGTLTLKDGSLFLLRVCAVVKADTSQEGLFRPKERSAALEAVRENALYYEEPEEGRLLALSTCAEGSYSNRTLVICEMTEEERYEQDNE